MADDLREEMIEFVLLYLKTYADTDKHPTATKEALVIAAARELLVKLNAQDKARTLERLQKQRAIEMAMTTRPDGSKIARRQVEKKIMLARQAAGLRVPIKKVRKNSVRRPTDPR